MATSDDRMKDIANRIRALREELGYSYQQLADITGMSKSTLQRYETGGIKNIPLSRLKDLADALQSTSEYLMGWEDEGEELSWVMDSYDAALKAAFPNNEFSRLQPKGRDKRGFPTWNLLNCAVEEVQFLSAYWRLNPTGRLEAKKRIDELAKLNEYVSESSLKSDEELREIDDYAHKFKL